MVMPTFSWSDVQRTPTTVDEALLRHQRIALHRRDGSIAYLITEREQEDLLDLLGVALAALAQSAMTTSSFLKSVYPWAAVLPAADQELFAHEFDEMARASVSLGTQRPLIALIRDWRHTAEAIASGLDLTSAIHPDKSAPIVRRPSPTPTSMARKKASKKAPTRGR